MPNPTHAHARQHKKKVDTEGFGAAMAEQRRRSKDSREEVDLTAQGALAGMLDTVG